MSAKRLTWDRQFWGIAFTGSVKDDEPALIGTAWHPTAHHPYPGAPSRPLLFVTRRQARAFCAEQHARWRGREDSCAEWRYRPIRVRELVTPMTKGR